ILDGGLKSECLWNIMRLTLDEALAVGSQLEIAAINGTDIIPLSPTLAAQCGYSMDSDPWGNTKVFVSLLGCYVDNQADETFNLGLRIQMYGDGLSKKVQHDVTETCSYSRWASREILCDRNYMEVSHHGWPESSRDLAVAPNSIWKMTFHTPDSKVMVLKDAHRAGYGAMTTPTRLVLRSPYNMPETYAEEVAGVPMEVFSVSTYYKQVRRLAIIVSAAACPTGGLVFTDEVITWYVPRRIPPLISSAFKILETHMGINGQRLDKTMMAIRRYKLSITESHVVIELPVGSPDGYYKSHAPDYSYHITYTVEPMLELLWRAEDTRADTRYKVLFPITTPLMPRPPHQKVFNVLLGTFLHDVSLLNITFTTGVLTVTECNARGFDFQEHRFANSSKTFSLQVPFSDEVVLKHNPNPLTTVYFLPLVFGLLILPEQIPFPHPAELEASLEDVVLPTTTGFCDQDNFYISVKYGSQGDNFQIMMLHAGSWRELDTELYSLTDNNTHVSIVVPYTAPDTVFETVQSDSIRARVDLLLLETPNMWQLNDLSLACYFPLTMTECYPNGTVTALAVKVESVRNLNPKYLTLSDQSCKPVFSNDRFAFFSFSLNSCGTTRTFFDNVMAYENEIAMHHSMGKHQSRKGLINPDYRHTVSCYYLVNDTETMAFRTRPRNSDPKADPGVGQLVVQMRLAQEVSYDLFYQTEDYPVVKYLQQPLYFEVELMWSTDPRIALVLENCWATLHEDRTTLPSWDLIVKRCENLDDRYIVFHPVVADARIHIPAHVKRFSVKMFTFTTDETVLKEQIFVHCDADLCDTTKPDGICSGQCASPLRDAKPLKPTGSRRGRRAADISQHQISSGPILLSDSSNFV
uniref:ZP domain-containing protein n=1 Tax=Oncorhynchus tshawytscha TaxID=74940 RepID=A0A8C8FPI0_ONCTS